MWRFAVLAILFAAVCAGPISHKSKSNDLDVFVVDSLDEYLAQNPDVKIVDELERVETLETEDRQEIVYRIGQRVNGDLLVQDTNWNWVWPHPQDIASTTLRYPANGSARAIVSFVHLVVGQASNIGRAVVVGGGIGQRSIQVLIQARHTSFLRYNARVFGNVN